MINIYQPSLGKEELNAIKEVFDSNWLGKGPKTEQFKKDFAGKLIDETAHGVGFVSSNPEKLFLHLSHK